jgi:hypothetical protein
MSRKATVLLATSRERRSTGWRKTSKSGFVSNSSDEEGITLLEGRKRTVPGWTIITSVGKEERASRDSA